MNGLLCLAAGIQVFISFLAAGDHLRAGAVNDSDPLKEGDSIVYYQCHVESAEQELRTASGTTLQVVAKNVSITEKFVLRHKNGEFLLQYFVSPYVTCPNRRFSGLKFSEKAYWEFLLKETRHLSPEDLHILRSFETIGKDANEYDLVVSAKNRNQLILIKGKAVKQVGLPEGLLLSKLFSVKRTQPN